MNNVIMPLQKNDFMIVKLILTDDTGNPIKKPYELQEGANTFTCLALYNDGTTAPFSPYWTCPLILHRRTVVNGMYRTLPEADVWGTFGQTKRAMVQIHASEKHTRYTELACWVFPPKEQTPTGNAEIPHDGTGFDYSGIDNLTSSA